MKQNPLNTMPNNEWEWFQRLGKARDNWFFQDLMPSVATIWQQFSLFQDKELPDLRKSGSSFLIIVFVQGVDDMNSR